MLKKVYVIYGRKILVFWLKNRCLDELRIYFNDEFICIVRLDDFIPSIQARIQVFVEFGDPEPLMIERLELNHDRFL